MTARSKPSVLVGALVLVAVLIAAGVVGVGRFVEPRRLAEARALYERGAYAQAERVLREVLALDRNDPSALEQLADVLGAKGDPKGALALYAKVLASKPRDTSLLLKTASLERLTGDPRTAAEHYQRACEIDPSNARAKDDLARTLLQLGRTDEALGLWDALAKDERLTTVERERYLITGAVTCLDFGRRKEAEAKLREALSLVPGDPQARALLKKAAGS